MTDEPMLEVRGLNVAYGAITAVRDVDLVLAKGEIVGLIGPNGAGKSSTMNAIVGLIPSQGSISLAGRRIDGWATEAIVRAGLTLAPEGRRVFPQLTVAENIYLAGVRTVSRRQLDENRQKVFDLFPVLAERREQLAGTLSGGEQQMLAIGRTLMSSPSVILLDEPSLGLAPQVTDTIFELIASMRAWQQTILLVEQNVAYTLDVADRGYVIANGTIRLEGSAAELSKNTDIQSAYFGVG